MKSPDYYMAVFFCFFYDRMISSLVLHNKVQDVERRTSMRYCKNCGAEIADGISFCKKCGTPVGKVPKQENKKKKWIFAISSGVILCVAVTVGVLFTVGIFGGKDDLVQTDNDVAAGTKQTGQEEVSGDSSENSSKDEDVKQDMDEKTSEQDAQSKNRRDSAKGKELLVDEGWKGQTFQKLGCYVMGDWIQRIEEDTEYEFEDSDYVTYCYPDDDETLEEAKEDAIDADYCVRAGTIGISADDNDILITEENMEYILGDREMDAWNLAKEDENLYVYDRDLTDSPNYHMGTALSVCVFVKNTYLVYSIDFSYIFECNYFSEREAKGKGEKYFAKSETYKAFINTIQYLGE